MSAVITIFCPNCGDPLQVTVDVATIGEPPTARGLFRATNGKLDVTFRETQVEHACRSRLMDQLSSDSDCATAPGM